MYRSEPEVSKICQKAMRERAYKQHLKALKKVHHIIDTSKPIKPRTIGKNFYQYELDNQKNLEISKQNKKLVENLQKIYKKSHFKLPPPQRPYTLQGRIQREEMLKITEDNEKIIKAVQNKKPLLNRNDWLQHEIEHEYQLHKISEFKPKIPISDIIKQKNEIFSARRPNPRNKHLKINENISNISFNEENEINKEKLNLNEISQNISNDLFEK